MSFNFELKKSLTDEEFVECFEYMKTYLVSIYGEDAISEDNFQLWKNHRIGKNNQYIIKMLKGNDCVGYAEIIVKEDNTLYFCDIIVKESMRMTRLVYEFVNYVLNLELFKEFEEIYLHINKKNKTSLNTWKILGLTEIEKGVSSNKYKLLRTDIENYFNRSKNL